MQNKSWVIINCGFLFSLYFIEAGDNVLMKSSEENDPPYVGLVERIEAENRTRIRVIVQWYYRPENTSRGRESYHGQKEIFSSEDVEIQPAQSIFGKCNVHTFNNYTELELVEDDDFYCRYHYDHITEAFYPENVELYCKCREPENPDKLMVMCEGCSDWFHPACVNITDETAKALDRFFCQECGSRHRRSDQVKEKHRRR